MFAYKTGLGDRLRQDSHQNNDIPLWLILKCEHQRETTWRHNLNAGMTRRWQTRLEFLNGKGSTKERSSANGMSTWNLWVVGFNYIGQEIITLLPFLQPIGWRSRVTFHHLGNDWFSLRGNEILDNFTAVNLRVADNADW